MPSPVRSSWARPVAKPPIAVRPMKSSANGVNPAMPSDVSKPALRARMYGKPLRLIPEPPSALVTRPRRRFATEGKPARGTAAESAGMEYMKTVELNNARWAMVGFATAVVMEAKTGGGIIPQLIMYGKMSGVLGADSGF